MFLSALLSSLPLDFNAALGTVERLGFRYVDVIALTQRPAGHRDALAESGLIVSCAAIGRDLPSGRSPGAIDDNLRQFAVEEMKQQLADASLLGATHAYLVPDKNQGTEGLEHFVQSCRELAYFAAGRRIKLCIEHFPGRALPTVSATLAWLDEHQFENLYLLLDVGHCLISGEDPAQAITQARGKLGYVHFDDNDGQSDLHWPLLKGRLTRETIKATLSALQTIGYQDGVALELNPSYSDPICALEESLKILREAGLPFLP